MKKESQYSAFDFEKFFQSKKHIIFITVGFFVGVIFFLGYFVGDYVKQNKIETFIKSFQNLREGNQDFSFVNPLLGSVSNPATDVGIYTDIRDDIKDYLEKEKREGDLYDVSFYFRELNSPLWFGVNEEAAFFPASLFKLPIAIVIYKQGEDDPSFLNKTLVYTQEMSEINRSIPGNEESTLIIGKEYSVRNLVEIMLEESDNGAKDLLASVIDQRYVSGLFNAMALIDPISATTYKISSRKYAFFLRILYNSGYLNKDHSEYILTLLSKSSFKEGIVAGVPGNIIVAHKFGTREVDMELNGKTVTTSLLSDCGIIYNKDSPYVICVMAQGKDIPSLVKIISNVSKMVYEDKKKEQ